MIWQENQIWIGAAIGEEAGAYCVYHGESNQGNFSDIYVKENELQDLDYGYVLVSLVKKGVLINHFYQTQIDREH